VPIATLKPNDRYAFVGKTRSGKTALAMVLAGTFARTLSQPWEVWWLDTKNDPKDIAALRKWGFRNAASERDRQPDMGGLTNAKYFHITEDVEGHSTIDQCQAICAQAYSRQYVIVCIDEYVQAVLSERRAGPALLNVFQRGGGKNQSTYHGSLSHRLHTCAYCHLRTRRISNMLGTSARYIVRPSVLEILMGSTGRG
jgi:hypothetical protein